MVRFYALVMSAAVVGSCVPKAAKPGIANSGAKLAAVTMPIPPALKPYVGNDKINAYSLTIKGGACDVAGTTGTDVIKPFDSLTADEKLANEKLRKGCDYTLSLSLGSAAADMKSLQKVYLTNDIEGKRTVISKESTRGDRINAVATLYVTEDGKKDLGIGNNIPVPTSNEVDAVIVPEISNSGSNQNPVSGFDWRKEIVLSDVQTYSYTGDSYGSAFYKDIMEHTPENERFFTNGRSTQAHESNHGLVNAMRNKTAVQDGFFYLENGKGAYVVEPQYISQFIKDFVGPNFQTASKSTYDLYLVQQVEAWPNLLYIWDEWNAYIATARSAVELRTSGKWDNENSDPFVGAANFVYYGCASIMALKQHDPAYMSSPNHKQFRATFAMLVEQSVKWINEGKKQQSAWPSASGLNQLDLLRNDAENENIRAAMREYMGADWTKNILGF